jgi:hypothetical protein
MVGHEALRLLYNGLESVRPRFYGGEDETPVGFERLNAIVRTPRLLSLKIDQVSVLLKPEIQHLADKIKSMGDKFIIATCVLGGSEEQGTVREPMSGLALSYALYYDPQHDDFVFRAVLQCRAFEWK